jgi:hypothetical protein
MTDYDFENPVTKKEALRKDLNEPKCGNFNDVEKKETDRTSNGRMVKREVSKKSVSEVKE